jgi:hypothetical protein
LQEKTTIGADPQTGYKEKTAWYQPGYVLGMTYNKREGESTPPFYLAKQSKAIYGLQKILRKLITASTRKDCRQQ